MKFVDALQRPVEVKRPPRRIVSLVPSLTEALFVFGLADAVVGVTKFCVEPREGVSTKAKVGGTKYLDVPRVLELGPDLVVASAEENRKEDIEALLQRGLNVFITLPKTVREGIELMGTLAEITGALEAAKPIIDEAEATVAELAAANSERPPVRTFCPIWRNPWMTVGPGSYMHDFITVCGARNIFADRWERYPKVDLFEMAERDPDVILLPDEPYPFSEKHVLEVRNYPDVSAVRSGRIRLLEGKHLCWYGPRIAGSLRYVSGLLHGT
ncbi:MAG: ABC transporter substrate-binding protein [Chloroflexi bacterium]|nr:ABC transporter substrate-binding protein [Chloroflexota bacterium]